MEPDKTKNSSEPPAAPHKGGPPKNLAKLAIAAVVMFLIAISVVWLAGELLQRPGEDPGSLQRQQAPSPSP